ncbi:hypothetical protein K0T92_18335 [Paenibacillus oenotherae]|uniref:Uncharacterized protein n=1 Tax=Paenibacillus oenotherae TaxID=1435645 RepID=A0ABS7D9Y4_9BACL|nr:hypothetical protein [Paenibacillus oenotherae]MBW7476680.1 hypothetical protein [Paenibacillus oenotherae]
MTRNTDVPASLAGYFYQLLVATRELLRINADQNSNLTDGVGVERGSDIRVFKQEGLCIETKFYKNKQFTKQHQTIRHTIYNFYHHYKNTLVGSRNNQYLYLTNVPISQADSDFFRNWPSIGQQLDETYRRFILDCVVEESINSEEPYKTNYALHKATIGANLKEPYYKQKLFEAIRQDQMLYNQYCEIIDDNSLDHFIQSLRFQFADQHVSKLETIQTIKTEAVSLLQSSTNGNALSEGDCEKVILHIIDCLFDTVIRGNSSYVKISDLHTIIINHQTHQRKYLMSVKLQEAIDAVEDEIRILTDFVNNDYTGSKADEIVFAFHELTEKLFSTLENEQRDLEELLHTFSIRNYGHSVTQVTALLRSMSILAVFLQRDPSTIQVSDKPGIVNFRLSEDEPYILKDASIFMNNRQIITQFVRQTLDHVKDLDFGMQVVFGTHMQPCKESKEIIKNMVMNIAEVARNDEYHELYGNLLYKCTKCLIPQEDDSCMYADVCKFIDGVCT